MALTVRSLATGLTLVVGFVAKAASVPSLPINNDFSGYVHRRQDNYSSSGWPYGPFSTQGRDIVNTRGEKVTWAGVNWPSSGETMVPEGLEWASVDDILSRIASVGFNFIRFPYAIEMIDQVYDRNGTDVPLEVAMINALGYVNGTKVTNEIVSRNPGWTKDTTRFEIWTDIARVAAEKQIFIHPDVHVHKAMWCCSKTDGNAWFDDIYFNVPNWKRGLRYIADWAKDHPNVVSMSLRNELRKSWNVTDLHYAWTTLVGNYTEATDAIHEANEDILVSWSGLQFDEDLSALTSGENLFTSPCYKCDVATDRYRRDPIVFDLASHPWANKVFYELHLYGMSEDLDTGDCPIIKAELYRAGFNALGISRPAACNITRDCPEAVRETPVVLTEFGYAQDATLLNNTLMNCLREFCVDNKISWAMWGLAGSYRFRSGAQGVGDTWALTNYEWDGWNYEEGIEQWWRPFVDGTGPGLA